MKDQNIPKKQPNERSKYTQKTKKNNNNDACFTKIETFALSKIEAFTRVFPCISVLLFEMFHKILHVVSVLPTIFLKNLGEVLSFYL